MTKPLIMVVDDEKEIATLIAGEINKTGKYETVIAHNGLEAVELLNKNKQFMGLAENKIKCIILDLKMPEMNGIQFLKALRKKELLTRMIPVIVLSAYEDKDKWDAITDTTEGMAAKYLVKPENIQGYKELIDTINRVFLGEWGYMIDATREEGYKRTKELSDR